MEALLESVTFLDGLRDAGVTGVEDIAAEELLKAEDLLQGIQGHTSEYEQMKTGLAKLSGKVAKLAAGDGKGYYIEERLRLADDISALQTSYLTTNISQALRQLNELETGRYKPLKKDVVLAVEKRKQFDKIAAKVPSLFDSIASVMAELGHVDGLMQSLVESGLLDKDATRYAGRLSLDRDAAVRLADNAVTHETLAEAVLKITSVESTAARQLAELKEYVKMKAAPGGSSAELRAYFEEMAKDYKDGLKRVERQKKDASAFDAAMKPMVQELEAMLRGKLNPERLLDKSRGFSRADPDSIDTARLRELASELKQLKQESAASHSHAAIWTGWLLWGTLWRRSGARLLASGRMLPRSCVCSAPIAPPA